MKFARMLSREGPSQAEELLVQRGGFGRRLLQIRGRENMRRIKQRDHEAGDCGVACAAMIAGCTYERAYQEAVGLGLSKNGTYYTTHTDLEKLLEALGVACERQRFRTMREVIAPAIVKVNPRQSGKYWHWVVLAVRAGRQVLLDPIRPGIIESFRGYKGGGVYLRAPDKHSKRTASPLLEQRWLSALGREQTSARGDKGASSQVGKAS